ncbi:unnamed protein product, partial [marine sediment metagenome]
ELKDLGLGIRKTNFYEIYRNEKALPEPSEHKREVSTPIKYRKGKPSKTWINCLNENTDNFGGYKSDMKS